MTKFNLSIIFFLLVVAFGCKKNTKELELSADSVKNYSDLVLNQAKIDSFFVKNNESIAFINKVNLFYSNRQYQYAWFTSNGMTQAVPVFYNQMMGFTNDFKQHRFEIKQLDTLISLINKDHKIITFKQKKQIQNFELLLTTTFFKYSKNQQPIASNLDWFIPKNKKNYQVLLDSLLINGNKEVNTEPTNSYYKKLKEKLRQYRQIQQNGGYGKITMPTTYQLNEKANDSILIAIKNHLFLTNDLKTIDKTMVYTNSFTTAIISFQKRLGLNANGILTSETIKELNVPIDFRIKQMMVNMERLRWLPEVMGKDFVLVNIPEFKLHVYKNNKPVWQSKIVVGKEAKKTSIFKGNIATIVLNPYWNIPASIINEELLPKLKKDPNYLEKNHMEVVSNKHLIDASKINWNKYVNTFPYEIRQKPGDDNAVGKIKFLFPNNFSIYIHDTPHKNLFNKKSRLYSDGCIRVENPVTLAEYILPSTTTFTTSKIKQILESNIETKIDIKPSFPVYITYFTAWVDTDGNLNFRNDIYNLDNELEKEIFSN